ncbi:conserved exported protein of unknown function [Georgfuchsia toluolica]|uniref:DUF1329 domain-containing protein n=1 Tax=Georgfuchsia toluolica TaxID=424218 RepID=A0A916N3A4_9PROT|nr:DUF1329 domain-containing protein [Georgfuchsia toluolica]CAG4884784.1 conserved exported protein of unknown function [Georgfuchsia toluolica]
MSNKRTILGALFALGISLCSTTVLALVTAEEAKQLGTTLTEFGAIKAGNADGSIPPYTGGIEKVAGYDPKTSNYYVDPFAGEKPLYSVNDKNMAQYDALLTEGTKAMMKQYGYQINVYPTHRSMRYTAGVLQNTLKNATTAKLGGVVEGDSLEGADKGNMAYAGIPFPIPKTGYEVMWNNNLRFSAAVSHNVSQGFLVDSAGNVSDLPGSDNHYTHPWYDVKNALRPITYDAYFALNSTMYSPPSSAGIVFLNYYIPNGQKVWFYTPGQRRIRLAPEFAYDVPIAAYGGVMLWDEVFGFVGRMDRFNFKLVGRKEMLVPYNVFGLTNTMLPNEVLGKKFINPAAVRFEKHRVWVVDSIRKPNARHAYSRKTFYIDEDCWCVTTNEAYDNANKLWRVTQVNNLPSYDTGGINMDSWTTYDLVKGNYLVANLSHRLPGNSQHSYLTAEGMKIKLTPQSVAAGGVR